MELFDGDEEKVKKLDDIIAKKMGFEKCFPVSGQNIRVNLIHVY